VTAELLLCETTFICLVLYGSDIVTAEQVVLVLLHPSIAPLMLSTSKMELRGNFLLGLYWTSQHKLVYKNKRINSE